MSRRLRAALVSVGLVVVVTAGAYLKRWKGNR